MCASVLCTHSTILRCTYVRICTASGCGLWRLALEHVFVISLWQSYQLLAKASSLSLSFKSPNTNVHRAERTCTCTVNISCSCARIKRLKWIKGERRGDRENRG